MTDKEKIKAEISRLQGLTMDKYGNFNSGYSQGEFDVLCNLEAFIDSLPEDMSEDLEEAAKKYENNSPFVGYSSQNDFMAGAQWQKQQIMSKAFDAEVKIDAGGYPYIDCIELYDYDKDIPLATKGDKVKLIIVKED